MDTLGGRLRRLLAWSLLIGGVIILGACGGSSSDSSVPTATGSIVLSIGDASGDFTSYAVKISQVTLTRDDGAVVKALPGPVPVDLSQLVSSSEIFGSASLPSGTYTSMTIDLDYTNANVSAENSAGQVVQLTPVSSSGNPLGTVAVTVKLSPSDSITVQQGTPLLASLDFDLAASNVINFSASPPSVTVSPFFYVVANPSTPVSSQASGTLKSVDVPSSSYTIQVAPLYYVGSNDFGSLSVFTDDQTTYMVNGTAYSGQAGLQALGNLATGTPTLAYGYYDSGKQSFQADEVYAGSSVPGASSDVVHGSVIARNADTVTVQGVTYVNATDTQIYHSSATVNLGTQTVVYKAGSPGTAVGLAQISVGSRVTILGTLTDSDPSSLTMDAGVNDAGYVRLEPAEVSGQVVAINSGQVNLDVAEINRHPVAWYQFAGTGTISSLDADPANYEVATGTLDLSELSVDEPAEFDGFVQPFGQAPPDFNAQNIGSYSVGNTLLMVGWRPNGTTAPFTVQNPTGLVINLSDPNIGPFAWLRRGGVTTDLSSLTSSPSIVPSPSGTGFFAIRQDGVVTIHVSFTNFVSDLQSRLNGSVVMTGLFGRGGYDVDENRFTVTRLAVNLR